MWGQGADCHGDALCFKNFVDTLILTASATTFFLATTITPNEFRKLFMFPSFTATAVVRPNRGRQARARAARQVCAAAAQHRGQQVGSLAVVTLEGSM